MNLLDKPHGLATFLPPEPDPPPPCPPPSIYASGRVAVESLENLDVAAELALAYQQAKRLAEAAEFDEATPLNQKAQIVNSLNSILASITKSRAEIYSAEQNRVLETALLTTLKRFPELQKEFMAAYKANLGSLGKKK